MADRRGEAARARRLVAFTLLAAVVGCSRESARRPAPSDVFVVSATSGGTSERVARIDRAIAFWTDRAHRDPFDWTAGTRAADAWVERARLTGDWRAYEAAEAALRRSLAVHPDDNAGALGRLARVLVARHRFADAAVAIEHALATAPPGRDGAWLHGVRGDVAFARGDFDAAARDYARFEAVTPGPAAWTRLANVAQTRGDLAGAEKFLRAALDATRERSPESAAWTGVQLAEVLRLSGRPEASERELAEAIRALPEYGPAWLHLADLHEAQGDRPRARRAVERARVHAVDPVARLQIARALERWGDPEGPAIRAEVRRDLEARLAAGDVSVRRELADLLLDAAERPEDLDGYARALAFAREDLSDRPGDPQALRLLARALRQTGAPREALAPVRAMLRLGTPDPTLHEEAARVYGALDMDDEAERQVILAGRLAPATSFRR